MADVILHLVDRASFNRFLLMPIGEISSGMEGCLFRDYRPDHDSRFHREFEVDLEGEILELIDGSEDLSDNERLGEIC